RSVDGRAPRRLRVWDVEQVRHFLAVSTDHPLADLWAVALGTGLRRGELLALRPGDVDIEAARLTVEVAVAQVGTTVQLKRPKTGRTRQSSLAPATTDRLTRRVRAAPNASAEAPLFAADDGHHHLPQRITDTWRAYVRTLDLPPIRLHDLRHTHATLLLAA